jgi:hypothetical protein
MARNEKSSRRLAALAGKILSGERKPTVADAKKLAGSVLTQTPNKAKGKQK